MLTTISPVLIAYLLGGVPFSLIVARIAGVRDLRSVGSGNLGGTNVWRVAGGKAAFWVFVGDIGKGVLAVVIARFLANRFGAGLLSHDVLLVLCALAAVLGHVFPIYLRFKGGKGVSTALGVMISLLPAPSLIALAAFVLVVLTTRYVSLGSMTAAVTLLGVVLVQKYVLATSVETSYLYLTLALAVLVVVMHRRNIARLANGTENRFSFSSRSKTADSSV